MENKKIRVMIADGMELAVCEGDFVCLIVFNARHGGTEMRSVCRGADIIPASVAEGAMGAVLNMVETMSTDPDAEKKMLAVIMGRLLDRVTELERGHAYES